MSRLFSSAMSAETGQILEIFEEGLVERCIDRAEVEEPSMR